MSTADLLIGSAEAEMQYRSGLTAPDEYIYLKPETGTATVYFDAREYNVQAEKLAALRNDVAIEALETYQAAADQNQKPWTRFEKILYHILATANVNHVRVSGNVPYRIIKNLDTIGITYEVYDFAAESMQKTSLQIGYLKQAQAVTNGAFDIVKNILAESTIRGEYIEYNGNVLTSEYVKAELTQYFTTHNYSCPHSMIVASRTQSECAHDMGSGPLYANQSIIVDLFPQSNVTGYYADMTRTFVKGTPSPALQAMYVAVLDVQHAMAEQIAIGMTCADVYNRTMQAFIAKGFQTSGQEGFTHGRTGHGLGLSVHEEPSLGPNNYVLQAGNVVTVEPGLYYKGIGGVRIEDVIVFYPNGTKENINTYSKDWIIP
jgi:Xaa-Pro aminopeptidase